MITILMMMPLNSSAGPVVRSENTPPEIINPRIEPVNPLTMDDLTAVYEVKDADGDENMSVEILWYRNGVDEPQYDNMTIIPSNATDKDQEWHYKIRAFDGTDYSNNDGYVSSFPVRINNSPPEITKYYPVQTSLTINETESITFSIEVEDMDEDIIFYEWSSNGKSVGGDEYYIFEADHNSAGTYLINVAIQDWGLNSVKVSMSWNVEVLNT
jgi:hypothetical protein